MHVGSQKGALLFWLVLDIFVPFDMSLTTIQIEYVTYKASKDLLYRTTGFPQYTFLANLHYFSTLQDHGLSIAMVFGTG